MSSLSVSESNSVKLDNLIIAVAGITEKISNMEDNVTEIRTDVKDLRKAIYGNGDPTAGIMGRVRMLEEWRDGQIWFQRLVVGTLLGELIGLGMLLVHMLLE